MKIWKILVILLDVILSYVFVSCFTKEEINSPNPWKVNEEFNKENCLTLYKPAGNNRQNIYILGTIHGGHFDKNNKYSLADIQSVIDTVNPDIILVEVRQETYDKYSILDGSNEMTFAWCYAKEKSIEVKGIDWWSPAVQLPNTTSTIRDDNIFKNIIEVCGNKRNILILIGAAHVIPLDERFINYKFRRMKITDKEKYFIKSDEVNFNLPKKYETELNKRDEYYQTLFPEEIYALPENNPNRNAWIKQFEK